MTTAAATFSSSLKRNVVLALRGWARRNARVDSQTVLRAARATMRRKRYCLLATQGDGAVDARVLQPFPPEEDLGVWFGTGPGSRKVAQLSRDPEATLVYEDDARAACVVLTGTVRVVTDLAERRRRFMPAWWAFFPEGPEGEYVLLHFVPHRVEVLDFRRRVTPEPFGLRAATLVRDGATWVTA